MHHAVRGRDVGRDGSVASVVETSHTLERRAEQSRRQTRHARARLRVSAPPLINRDAPLEDGRRVERLAPQNRQERVHLPRGPLEERRRRRETQGFSLSRRGFSRDVRPPRARKQKRARRLDGVARRREEDGAGERLSFVRSAGGGEDARLERVRARQKLVDVELQFDVMAFMQQLQPRRSS